MPYDGISYAGGEVDHSERVGMVKRDVGNAVRWNRPRWRPARRQRQGLNREFRSAEQYRSTRTTAFVVVSITEMVSL